MNSITIKILKFALWHKAIPEESVSEDIYRELCEQTIHILVYDVVDHTNMNEILRSKWSKSFAWQISFFSSYVQAQQKMVQLLSAEGFTPIILKGLSAAMYYPEPTYRCLGDIDFLLFPQDDVSFSKASKILIENGYKCGHETSERLHSFNRNGIEFEMHRFFSTRDTSSEIELERIISSSIPIYRSLPKWPECCFYSFSDEVNGLIFLEHINQHLISGLGFRQIMDWLFFVESTVTDDFWINRLLPLTEQTGLTALAKSITRMNEIYFGAPVHSWAQNVDTKVCESLFNLIDGYGNFGRKLSKKDTTTTGVLTKGVSFRNLQKRGLHNWPAAQKHKILRPFAWLYQICRYIKKGLFERDPNSEGLLKSYKRHREQKKLFKKLGLWQYRE